jgi:hypothetical protein
MTRPLSRVEPALDADAMKTYGLVAPLATHWRPATCEEVDCPTMAAGWRTAVDEAEELGQRQAHYIRHQAGRRYVEHREGALTVFIFEAGQPCFAAHQAPLEREPIYLVRGGDWRGNPRGTPARVHTRPADWVDDFATHQQRLADRLQEG